MSGEDMNGARPNGGRAPADRPAARIVVVDDSRVMRRLICDAVDQAPDLTVVGVAGDPIEAREVIRATDPDAITLDVEMPKMNGLEFLRRIMALRPTPVVMVAGRNTMGAEMTIAALEAGAVDYVRKPSGAGDWSGFGAALRQRLRVAARMRMRPPATPAEAPETVERIAARHHDLIAIGASTGGVGAIAGLVGALPPDAPPTLIVQHMPKEFTTRFAVRLARALSRDVAEARAGEALRPGVIRIAPGDSHLTVERRSDGLATLLDDAPPMCGHRPSVDRLFLSVAEAAGRRAVGVILTGMGRDGAAGLLAMRQAGAATIGESAETCVVYGMSRAAKEAGAVERELPLGDIPAHLSDILRGKSRPRRNSFGRHADARREIAQDPRR